MAARILVVEHQRDVGADALGEHLTTAGTQVEIAAVAEGATLAGLDAYDGLVVLGGEMDVWQEDAYPWLIAEKAGLRAWLAGPPRPLLGICLGHQLLADALGGEVGLRATGEAGIRSVQLTEAGRSDPLLAVLGQGAPVLQWHGAEVTRPPAGAVVLATTDSCAIQAMRVGPAAWGVQFHPEVGRRQAEEWGRSPTFGRLIDEVDGPGQAAAYPAVLAAAADEMARITHDLAVAFVEQVALRR